MNKTFVKAATLDPNEFKTIIKGKYTKINVYKLTLYTKDTAFGRKTILFAKTIPLNIYVGMNKDRFPIVAIHWRDTV